MSLASGTRLGPYEITGPLGAGGMGEVYKARDTRLDRTVAIKVLPQLFAIDPTFRGRFDREARAISALNHPNICTLHDIGTEGTTSYLVMECVDGQPVAGPMPIARAIPIALQICDALDAAHRAGIVHRDLKPSNILVSKSPVRPQVKLLDFGLATRADAAHGNGGERATISALTGAHTIVGTPQYMAPEQIEGREVDARTDIFALGCVLYELLTGKHAFDGHSPSSVMAAILAREPRPLRELVPITPPTLDWIVTRALAKDPNDRWQTVRDLRAALERVLAEPQAASAPASGTRRARVGWAFAALAALAAVAFAALWARAIMRRPPADTGEFISDFLPPTSPTGSPVLRLALSPDGRRLAYTAPDAAGHVALWVRSLDSLTAQPLPGTTNASAPFWSPDSRFIAFQADGKLKKIDASGGPVTTICDATPVPPGTWNKDDVILMTGTDSALVRVPASGGTPRPVLPLDQKHGELVHITPSFLPDGRHFIYGSATAGSRVRGIYLASLDSPATQLLVDHVTSNVVYAAGHILFLRNTTLMAQRLDPDRLTVSGEAAPIVEQIQTNPTTGTGAFTASQNGVLAYQTNTGGGGSQLAWLDRSGRTLETVGERAGYFDLQLAHDGRRASVTVPGQGGGPPDVWIYDLARKLRTPFTFGPQSGTAAIWSPDDRQIVYAVRRDAGSALMRKAANGAGVAEVLFEDARDTMVPLSWSPDGRFLLYQITQGARSGKLAVLPLTGDRKPYMFPDSPFSEVPGEFSPDGKWVAYVSTQSGGHKEVYVTSFPKPSGVWRVSADGGDFPRWRRDGREIFFLTDDKLMSAAIETGRDDIVVGEVKALFPVRWPVATRSPYDVSADGQRILMNVLDDAAGANPITIVVNWTAGIKN